MTATGRGRGRVVLVAAAVGLVGAVVGCSSAGEAGGAAGQAAQQAGQAAQQAGQQAGQAAQQAGQAAGDAAGRAASAAAGKIQGVLAAHPVTFRSESAELSEQDVQTLRQIADVLKTTGASVTVATHAGYPDAARAQQLSQQRADNIAQVLRESGVDPSKVKTRPSGNSVAQGDEALRTQLSTP